MFHFDDDGCEHAARALASRKREKMTDDDDPITSQKEHIHRYIRDSQVDRAPSSSSFYTLPPINASLCRSIKKNRREEEAAVCWRRS